MNIAIHFGALVSFLTLGLYAIQARKERSFFCRLFSPKDQRQNLVFDYPHQFMSDLGRALHIPTEISPPCRPKRVKIRPAQIAQLMLRYEVNAISGSDQTLKGDSPYQILIKVRKGGLDWKECQEQLSKYLGCHVLIVFG